jgi:phosphatidate cytidylyltransferase
MLLSNPLANPLAHPFLAPLGWTLVGLFAGSLMTLLVSVRGQWRMLRASVLFQRWRTWLVIAPLYSLVVLSGPLAVAVFAAALALQASREYARLTAMPAADRIVLLLAAILAPLACLAAPPDRLAPAMLLLPLLASVPVLLSQDTQQGATRLARLTFGLWYLPLALATLVLFAGHPRGGAGVLLALGLATALSDVGAFTFGKLLKGPRLVAHLSPSKTWAGCLGNVAGAALGLGLLRPLAPDVPFLALLVVVAVGAIWGDLLESLLKRQAGAKDSGAWLSGFGGLLDRVDSLLVVLPLAFVVLQVTA